MESKIGWEGNKIKIQKRSLLHQKLKATCLVFKYLIGTTWTT